MTHEYTRLRNELEYNIIIHYLNDELDKENDFLKRQLLFKQLYKVTKLKEEQDENDI